MPCASATSMHSTVVFKWFSRLFWTQMKVADPPFCIVLCIQICIIIINGLILPLHPVLCCFKRDSKFVFLIKVLVLLTLFSSSLHFQRAAAPYCLSRMLQCSFVRSQEPWPYRMLLLVLMFDVKALSDECSKTSSQWYKCHKQLFPIVSSTSRNILNFVWVSIPGSRTVLEEI